MARFLNRITRCLTNCDKCTGAYSDEGDVILLNCCCRCHKNDKNEDLGDMDVLSFREVPTKK